MIRPIDIRLNAAHPELPLAEAVTFTGSPSTVLIRGVPPNCGRWAITAVSVAASFPDGSTSTRAAVQSANGVWVATLPATATSGRTANGIRVMADGIDENGDAVTGYILGVADFAVASLDVTPAPEPGETSYQMLYFDAVPATLRKGDVAKTGGVLEFYNGTAWEPFAAPPTLDDAVTRTSANGVKSSGIWSAIWGALSALPTGFASLYDWCVDQLVGKLDKTGGTMTGPLTIDVNQVDGGTWLELKRENNSFFKFHWGYISFINKEYGFPGSTGTLALTAGRGHTGNLAALDEYGNPTDSGKKPSDFQSALSDAQLANIAAVSDALAFDATHSYTAGDPVVYNGTLYTFNAAHTGAWTGSDVSAVDIIARLADKADKCVPQTAGNLAALDSQGNPTDSLIPAANVALKTEFVQALALAETADAKATVALQTIPYTLGTLTVIDNNSVQTDTTDPNNPIDYGAATLANRTANIVQVTAATALDELRITFPAATSGKVRDFGLRVEIGTGSAALTAPALVPIAPTGETIKLENADGTIPALADGTATAKGVTLLYFSENAPGVFVVKGEQVEEVA